MKEQDFTDEYNFVLTKYYQRYLHPLTCILFAAIGCLLGFSPPRSQRLIGFTVAVGMIFAYYITLPFFDLMAQKSVIPPFLAAAFPIIIAFIISIFFHKRKLRICKENDKKLILTSFYNNVCSCAKPFTECIFKGC